MTDEPAELIENEEQLERLLTRPRPALVEFIPSVSSPLLVLGAGGKMGPTLAILAKRAAEAAQHSLRVVAVSRFNEPRAREVLEREGVETISCDLFDRAAAEKLPDATSILYLVGLKFGTAQNPSATWAMNTIVPARIMERFPQARIVALSTGNVYPLSEVSRGSAPENAALTPLGEYANAAVARERIFEFYSRRQGTLVALLRLFYAVEPRYGVLVDIARKVHAGEAIDTTTGAFNCIWQADANEFALRALALAAAPASVWNLCRLEIFSVREVAARFGQLLGRQPVFIGQEAATALLGNSARLCERLGEPPTRLEQMIRWIAHWVGQGGRNLGRPTHFEVRDGNF